MSLWSASNDLAFLYKLVLRNTETNLVKMKQDGFVTMQSCFCVRVIVIIKHLLSRGAFVMSFIFRCILPPPLNQ
ncbi:unnamed protein product [Lactuca virosa]|uniref:Uncharacterized protein n=1 Tax=Lactuca virosa TaxID=75947 RepID=A0AAU9MHX5_9ASTR|nr:unnamed protein product [Lactuca virosa]